MNPWRVVDFLISSDLFLNCTIVLWKCPDIAYVHVISTIFIRNKTQTAVTVNMAIKLMMENKVHLLDVSYVSIYISEVTVRNSN